MNKTVLLLAWTASALMLATVVAVAVTRQQAQAQSGPLTITQNGTTLVAPDVRCAGDPVPSPLPYTRGIVVRASNVTIINPHVENCQAGISIVRNSSGQVVSNVRILGNATQPGYATSEIRHNRVSIDVHNVNGAEIGDVSEDGVDGGRPLLVDTYRGMEAEASQNMVIDDISLDCGTTVWGTGAPNGGCHAGVKWLADRPSRNLLVRGNVVSDMLIRGVDDESISIDGRFDERSRAALIGTDTIAALSATKNTVTLTDAGWKSVGENLVGQYLTVATGSQQGRHMRITSHAGRVFKVADPKNTIGSLAKGEHTSIGMAYDRNSFTSNTVYGLETGGKVHIDTHGVGNFTRISDNRLLGRNAFPYSSRFQYRELSDGSVAPQCINVRTGVMGAGAAGGTTLAVSAKNTVANNYCENGDISLTAVTWATPPSGFRVDNNWDGNVLQAGQIVTKYN